MHAPLTHAGQASHQVQDATAEQQPRWVISLVLVEGSRERLVEQLLDDLRAWDERTKAEAAGVRIEGDPDTIGKLQQMGYIDR